MPDRGKTMTEKGRVVHIDDKTVTLKFLTHEGCDSCGSSFCNVEERAFTAHNNNDIPIEIGDIVKVLLPTGKTIGASFMLLLLPLLLFILFYRIGEIVLDNPGEGLTILFATIGLGVGFGITFLIRWVRRERDYPEIIGKENREPLRESC
jgi:positive regulator of sigma E activity